MSTRPLRLEQIQRWMQTVIMHPGGVSEGVDSPEAREHVPISLPELEKVIRRSEALSSANRLEIYVNAYHARLLECLDEEFAVTRLALGDELFSAVAFGYLQQFPSQSYTLGQLGANFPSYLAESRLHAAETPPDALPSWPEFIAELARFERVLYEVYDGPGTERGELLSQQQLAEVRPEDWGRLRLLVAPCLRLCTLTHPVHEYWSSRRDDEEPAPYAPRDTWLAISRWDFAVEHRALAASEYALLAAIVGGANLDEALAAATEPAAADGSSMAANLTEWFANWMRAGYFTGVAIGGTAG